MVGQLAWLVGFGFVALGGSSRQVWKGAKFEIVVGRIKFGELVEPVMYTLAAPPSPAMPVPVSVLAPPKYVDHASCVACVLVGLFSLATKASVVVSAEVFWHTGRPGTITSGGG